MPHCKTCQISSPFHELIDGLCHKCTARELKKCKDACQLFVDWCKTPDPHLTPEIIDAMHEVVAPSEKKPLTTGQAKELVEDIRKLHSP